MSFKFLRKVSENRCTDGGNLLMENLLRSRITMNESMMSMESLVTWLPRIAEGTNHTVVEGEMSR